MPKNTARPDESEWRNIESGEVSYTKDFEIDRIFNFDAFKLERQPFIKIVKLKNLLKAGHWGASSRWFVSILPSAEFG